MRQLQGRPGPEGWISGVAEEMLLLPRGGAAPAPGSPLQVRPLPVEDPLVAAQIARHASRHRRPA
ncbi:hypothetical protein ACWF9B_00055 [Streptomyces sp. NPDC055089]